MVKEAVPINAEIIRNGGNGGGARRPKNRQLRPRVPDICIDGHYDHGSII
jgi:hypothetical protein